MLLAIALSVVSGGIFSRLKLAKPGYVIPVAAQSTSVEGSTPPAVVAALPIEQRLAAADENKGQADVIPCQSCHNFEKGAGRPTSGPSLFGVVGRAKGSVQGFEYSEALKSEGGNRPLSGQSQAFAQDTKMACAGESDPAKRADTIDYLHSLSENPEPLPAN